MKPTTRSISGAVTAILMIPFIIGLLACLPVPIGDPERSRVDEELSGIWLQVEEEGNLAIVLFEPFDKRTWLVTLYGLDIEEESCEWNEDEPETRDEIMLALRTLGKDCLKRDGQSSYKAWRKKLADTWFLTWEPKALFDTDHGFEPALWLGYRIEKSGEDEFILRPINPDDEAFNELDENKAIKKLDEDGLPRDPDTLRSARRAFERVLKRNAKNEDIYSGSELDPRHFFRIQPDDYSLFAGKVVPDELDL